MRGGTGKKTPKFFDLSGCRAVREKLQLITLRKGREEYEVCHSGTEGSGSENDSNGGSSSRNVKKGPSS